MGGFSRRDDLGTDSINVYEYVTRGASETLHWHQYLQVGVCTGGKGKFIFTNKEFDVEPGDVFVVGNFENHVAISELPECTTYIFAIFQSDFIAPPGSRQFDYEYLHTFRYNPKTFNNKINHDDPVAIRIAAEMEELRQVQIRKDAGYRHALDAGLRTILALLINHYKKTYPDYYVVDEHNRVKMQAALDYIHKNFTENVTLEDMAKLFHISESRFRHLFKETIQIGFKEYITYLRLSESRKLLLTTDLNVSDIANNSGYTNIHQFYKVFYKYVFMSPAEYRSLFKRKHSETSHSHN